MAFRVYRYRIYPTKSQAITLNTHLSICAELYNSAVEERRSAWKSQRKSISRFDQIYQLPEIRKQREDVAGVSSYALDETLTRVDRAFKAFFRRVKAGQKAGYPRFRSVRRYDSLTLRQDAALVPVGNKLRVSKIGKVRIKVSRPVEGKIKTLTIKREAGRWFAVFVCEVTPLPLPFNPNAIGIDVGLAHFATLNTGEVIDNPRHYRGAERKLRVAQRRLSRRQKGSNRRRKAVQILQRVHAYVHNQRADFHHKLSRRLVNEKGLIAAEDLNIKGLARTRTSKSINDAGWGQFLNMIAYKAEDAGRVFVRVNPAGTSQTCICGAEVRKTLSQRWHLCLSCGLSASRDHVSAQVILSRAEVQRSGVNVGVLVPCVA